MKISKKIVSFLLIFVMAFGTLIGSVSEVQAAEEYYPFSVNLFNFNTSGFLGGYPINDLISNDGSLNNAMQFTSWTVGSGINASNDTAFQGIVKNEVDAEGNIQFNENYSAINFLNTELELEGRDVYTNVQLPFQYTSDGYYTFDSAVYDVYFSGTPESGATLITGTPQVSVGEYTGFFPFNDRTTVSAWSGADHHFGMTFSTEFFMTANGRIDGTENGEPIKFEFAGDDDVWVFVDGKLVLDIGGIHGAISGEIDFAEGTATVNGSTNPTTNTEAGTDLWALLGTTADVWRNSATPHTLQVFYLERGAYSSNCKIKFNLPQKNCVSVTKMMGNEFNSQTDLDKLNELSFDFKAYTAETNETVGTPFANRIYYLFDSNGTLLGGYRTDENGAFSLKFNQTARFYMDEDIYDGKSAYIYILEEANDLDLVDVTWNTSNTIANDGFGEITTSTGLVTESYSPILEIKPLNEATSAIQQYSFSCTNEVADPQAVDDLVVLDFGKSALIDVLKNDVIFTSGTTVSINATNSLENGTAVVVDDNGEDKIQYTPTKFMDSIDELQYTVTGDFDDSTATVQIMPANNVYYEDNFAINNGGTAQIIFDADYTTDTIETTTTSSAGNAAGTTQDTENKVYGQDASYANQNGFSDGSATAMDTNATATFTFKGTGVDIYTKTDTESPVVAAWIYEKTTDAEGNAVEKLKQMALVDNKYDKGILYQIPTICFDIGAYGEYKVVLQVMPNLSDSTKVATYYLDAIRIYNPIDPDSTDAEIVNDAYQEAGEANTVSTEVRDLLISAQNFVNGTSANGVVYLDNLDEITGNPTISDYEKDGPKNEVYLSAGNAIGFTLAGYDDTQKVYLGVKAPEGTATTIKVTDGTTAKEVTVTSATDMYIPVTPTSNGQVLVENLAGGTNGLLAITKVRVAGASNEPQVVMFMVDEELMTYASEFSLMRAADNADTDVDTDIDVDIDNPEDSTEDTGSTTIGKLFTWVNNLISGLRKLIGRR